MTVGIYGLWWEQSSMIYIGKSVHIEARYKEHCYALKAHRHYNNKITSQYTLYGIPELMIIEKCDTSIIDSLEMSWVREFDSIKYGLNILIGGTGGISDCYGGNSSHSKNTILKVFSLLYKGILLYKEIATRLNVPISLSSNIVSGQHAWLGEEYPIEYARMLAIPRSAKSKKGMSNPACKSSKATILKVFSLLYRTKLSRVKIANRLNITESLPKGILGGAHSWLKEEYPEQYSKMLNRKTKAV